MTEGIWFSPIAGAGIAFIHSVVALWLGRLAQDSSDRTYMMILMGGMVARIFVTIIILTIVLLLTPVNKMTFLAGFFVVFTLGLTAEIVVLHRRQQAMSQSSSGAATD